jgi:hypothetical protein
LARQECKIRNFGDHTLTAKVQVDPLDQGVFQVQVIDSGSKTSHRVTVRADDYARLAQGKAEPSELVRRSFEFLLEHEPKESILSQFDLRDISRYFPNFEQEIKRRISGL